MSMITVDYDQNIAILKLNRGVVNSIDLDLVTELTEVLHQLKRNPEVNGLVFSSANEKFFSIGFDIPNLFPLSKEAFTTFFQAYNRLCLFLFTFPKPTVAAITGHAIAGGCILTLCCDYRVLSTGRILMGLNEIRLGVPVPFPADCMLKQIIGIRKSRDVMECGEFFLPEQLLEMGMVDEITHFAEVIPGAFAKVKTLSVFPEEAFKTIKGNRVKLVEKRILEQLKAKEKRFIDLWYSEQTRQLLMDAMEKF